MKGYKVLVKTFDMLDHFGEIVVDPFSMSDEQYNYLLSVSVNFVNGAVVSNS